MDRFALLVDAGYFFAGGSEAAFGSVLPRKQLRLKDPAAAIQSIQTLASELCDGIQLLRVYWYDAMPGPTPSLEQSELALLSGLKLRLGVLNNTGQQKGVDALIVTDLIDLARNRAVTDAVLVSGDEDVRVGVQLAQSFGLKVHLWGAGDATRNVSRSLRMESDTFRGINWWLISSSTREFPESSMIRSLRQQRQFLVECASRLQRCEQFEASSSRSSVIDAHEGARRRRRCT